MESNILNLLSFAHAQHPPETEDCMYEGIGNGLYRFVLSVRVPGIETPRRRVLVEQCRGDDQAEAMIPALREKVRAEILRSLTKPIETLKDAIDAYKKANPLAKWGEDRYNVALNWAGSLVLDKTIMVEFDNVVKLFKTTKTKFKAFPSASTVNKLINLCKASTRYCYINYLADRNWLDGYKKVPEFNERAVYVTREMLDLIIAELPKAPTAWRPLVMAAYYTGMRQGELRALRMQDVDLFTRRITLHTSKTGRPRMVPIDEALIPYFASRSGSVWAFEINGHPVEKFETCQAWRRAAVFAGMSYVRLHDLRGTFGTDLIESGVPEKVVMEIMGHFSRSSFLRYQKVKHDCQLDQALAARRTGRYDATTKTTTKAAAAGGER